MTIGELNMKVKVHDGLEKCSIHRKKKKYSSTKSCLTNASWFCVIMNDQKMQRYDTTKE